ncbi:MAG: hypothetical protein HGB11_10315 [Chlorobiales bacterium]|nr:hypothetical protein [Chlorobiales bacterium]
MNMHLVEFVDANLNETIWLITPGGLISGKLHDIDKKAHTLGLINAFHHFGSVKNSLGDIHVNADQVSAWGMDEPTSEG